MLRKRWTRLKQKPDELDFLKLLARMELTKSQAERVLKLNPKEILINPYRLFEEDRTAEEPVAFGIVDRALHPGKEVASVHPLPKSCSPILREYDNPYRLRGACVDILESGAIDGHTLLTVEDMVDAAQDLSAVHEIALDVEVIDICRDNFKPVISVIGSEQSMMLQLDRYVDNKRILETAVNERLDNEPKKVSVNWRRLVNDEFRDQVEEDTDEGRARAEKVTALEQLAKSRIAVLIGPAGTGKTTVLHLLLSQIEIVGPRVKLLAPTGKARVRLGQRTQRENEVQTVAQCLIRLGRYDAITGRYYVNSQAAKIESTTCIIDEASMLTEDMLAAIVDAVPTNCRLILVGDPYQLPPIGAGCPFVDIIEYLKDEKNGTGVGELTVPRRQGDVEGNGSMGHAFDSLQGGCSIGSCFFRSKFTSR